MKPFIKYPGGKMHEFALVNKFKPKNISRYFEPFVGGAAIYLNINIVDSHINDVSKDLINCYYYTKQQDFDFFTYLKELDRIWKKIEYSNSANSKFFDFSNFSHYVKTSLSLKNKTIAKAENLGIFVPIEDKNDTFLTAKKTALYMCIRDVYNKKSPNLPLHTACFYFIREYCYSSMFRFSKKGIFNVPYGGRSYNKKYITSKIEQMRSSKIINYFKNTTIHNLDFEEFLNLYELNNDDFIFLDPPYDTEFSTYDRTPFNKNEQLRLAKFLQHTNAKWMLIIKKTDFIYNLYKNFYLIEYNKNYLVNFKNRNAKDTTHLLITNYIIKE